MADGAVRTHDRIRFENPDFGRRPFTATQNTSVIETTVGRVIFNEIWPKDIGFFNKAAGKKQLGDIIWRCYQVAGQEGTVETLDKLKELGFREATKAGVSIGISDMIIPKEKEIELQNAYKQIRRSRSSIARVSSRGRALQQDHRHLDARRDQISNVMFRTLEHNEGSKEFNPVYLMVDSGARGNRQQVRQLAGVRGLMAKPSRAKSSRRPILRTSAKV